MRLATREEIYRIDQEASRKYDLPSKILVERAGVALAEKFLQISRQQNWPTTQRIGVWCGRGHNGDDGRVMARILSEKKFSVQIFEDTAWDPAEVDIVVDAYFGVGLNRDVVGETQKQIQKINRAKKLVIAVDIPSGLDANRGVILGEAVRAAWTLTIAPGKPGLFLQEGPQTAGHIRRVDLGFPEELLRNQADSVFLIGNASARSLLPSRGSTANKSHFGHLLVVAGSPGMEGAASLVCEAAARMGCGYVTLCSFSPEISRHVRPDFLRLSPKDFFKSDLQKYTAVVVGPGLGTGEATGKILDHLHEFHGKVLVDADALTLLSRRSQNSLPPEWLLTPHAGELGRLLKVPAKDLEGDRLGAVDRAVRELNAHILFKGYRTVLGSKGKRYIIGSGNVALAKAGTGDVLAGFVGSLMAQGLPTTKAAALGAYLHGRIADDWLRRGHSSRSLLASELPEFLDSCLRRLKKAP
jgi:hydroxyethylthiazole kinase-like uncharacterized protein yjeF